MESSDEPMVRCAWCRRMRPADAETCPHCGRVGASDELRPLGGSEESSPDESRATDKPSAGTDDIRPLGEDRRPPSAPGQPDASGSAESPDRRQRPSYTVEPLAPAPGQDNPLTWAYLRLLAKEDPAYSFVLALAALSVLMSFVNFNIIGLIFSIAVFWGLLSFQWWGYLIAMFGALLGVLAALGMLGLTMAGAASSGTLNLAAFISALFHSIAYPAIALILYRRRSYFG